jgi:CBS domain-containing protein
LNGKATIVYFISEIRRDVSMQVKEIMSTNIVALAPDNTILDAAKAMQAHNIGCAPVCQPGGKVAGILTDRDIVVRNLATNGDPKTTLVKDVMTKNVISAEPDMDINAAAETMAKNKIRRLPVLQNGSIVGMIAIGDLATQNIFHTEAREALSEISEPSKPMNLM